MVHQPFKADCQKWRSLRSGQRTRTEFVSAPNLHWPDTFSYDRKTQILYTCDAFGLHYCDDHTFDEDLGAIEADFDITTTA